jgi:cytidylate kinase
MIVAIEGPAGSGKSTMATTVAAEMEIPVIEGGGWYRALTYKVLRNGIDTTDTARILETANSLKVEPIVHDNGRTMLLVDGVNVGNALYSEEVGKSIANIAQKLEVREVIEPQIAAAARSYENVIVVGRQLKRAIPEARVLMLTIADDEAERRHIMRAGEAMYSVTERNRMDKKTGELLGRHPEDETTIDVTGMSKEEQASLLRRFFAAQGEA